MLLDAEPEPAATAMFVERYIVAFHGTLSVAYFSVLVWLVIVLTGTNADCRTVA